MIPSNDELVRIGCALKALREKRKYSQNRLAKKSGVPQATISRIERGKEAYEFGSLIVLLNVLNVQLGDFFTDAGFTLKTKELRQIKIEIVLETAGRVRSVSGKLIGEVSQNG